MHLDERLTGVASMVRQGSRVADIGTDHAFLPVALVAQGRCPFAIAADIRTGPAGAAARTVEEAGLTASISVRIGDGLAPIAPNEVDDIVIAGMGGETMVSILSAAPWVKNEKYRLILQPMTKPECIREYLLTNGFSIETERVVQEGERLYAVLTVSYTAAPTIRDDAAAYIGGIDRIEGAEYLEKQRTRLLKRACGLHLTPENEDEIKRLTNIAQRIENYICGEKS